MVWGVPFPPGPYGEYEGKHDEWPNCGWWARLQDHFANEMTEEQRAIFGDRSYWYCVHEKFVSNGNDRMPDGDDILLPPIEPHEPPRYFHYERGHKKPAAIISLPGKVLAVSEPFKSFVEWLEPDVHRFFPIDIRNSSGSVYEVPYFLMVIGRTLDSFVPDKSAKETFRQSDQGRWYMMSGSKSEVTGIALDREVFVGSHMWVEAAYRGMLIGMSDELVAEVKDAGLKMPKHWQTKEV